MSETDKGKPWAAALGRIASGLFVLTARHDGKETGMLASWVMQCSFEPPQLTIALKRGRQLEEWLRPGAGFVINVLDDSQTDMIVFFGKGIPPGEGVFGELELDRTADGTAILAETLAFLECRVESHVPAGDHELLLARVVGGRMLNEGQPMVHVRKSGLHY